MAVMIVRKSTWAALLGKGIFSCMLLNFTPVMDFLFEEKKSIVSEINAVLLEITIPYISNLFFHLFSKLFISGNVAAFIFDSLKQKNSV